MAVKGIFFGALEAASLDKWKHTLLYTKSNVIRQCFLQEFSEH